ncbi:PEPxxWA-CTERM sorting domain-containing protein [Sphingomonas sp. CFBP 8760]|nr:PEPxxWA-CTERM sorting domain-containing protein [Sphingomonas sp. CFBP 8760]
MDNSFGSDGIVISPDTLRGGPFNSTRTLPQFQFRGPSNAIGGGGVANGLPLASFSPTLFVSFGNDTGSKRVYGDLTVYISSVVPEPATWAMMIVGFGMLGAATRYRRRPTTTGYA